MKGERLAFRALLTATGIVTIALCTPTRAYAEDHAEAVEAEATAPREPASAANDNEDAREERKTRNIIGGVSMGVGALFAGIAAYEVVHYLNLQAQGEDAAKKVPFDGQPCKNTSPECADIDRRSKTATTLAFGFGTLSAVAFGFGTYMFLSRPASEAPAKPTAKILPSVSVGSASVDIVGTF